MQASKIDGSSPTSAAAAARPPGSTGAAKDPPRAELARPRFGAVLSSAKGARAAAHASAVAGEARPAAPFVAPPREVSVRAAAPRPEISRLLVAPPHAPPEARIELRGGIFAGAAIRIVPAPGGVEVRLGAPTEAARAALEGAIDRARHRLGSRGIVMRPGASLDSGSRQNERERRGR